MIKLTKTDASVLRCLKKGSDNRVTMRELKTRTGMSVRAIYESIETIRLNGVPVMASRQGNNGGYFIAETELEKQAGISQYKRQIATEQRNLQALEQANTQDWEIA